MTKPTTAAHFVACGTTDSKIETELSEDELGRINERLHEMLADAGVDVESIALVTGNRAEELLECDRENW